MTDAHGIARLQLKSIVERVERLEAEIADLNADKSDIYKDARSNGFDVKAIKKVVSRRKLDDNKRVEEDAVFETYWDAIHGTGLVHAHAREKIEKFDAETGEILDDNSETVGGFPVAAAPTSAEETGGYSSKAARVAAENVVDKSVTAGETASEIHANPEEEGACGETVSAPSVDAGSRPVVGRSTTATSEEMDVTGGESAAASCEYCDDTGDVHRIDGEWLGFCHCEYGKRLQGASEIEIDPTEDRSEGHSLDGETVGANTGGGHVTRDGNAQPATAGGLVRTTPAKPLRPHCLRPENCGGYGSNHCFSCKKAAKANEEEVAA